MRQRFWLFYFSGFKGSTLYALINTMLTGLDVNRLFISQLINTMLTGLDVNRLFISQLIKNSLSKRL